MYQLVSFTCYIVNNDSSSGVSGTEDAVSVGLQQDETTIWLRSRERDGSGWRRTGLFSESWGRPVSNSAGLSAGTIKRNNFMESHKVNYGS